MNFALLLPQFPSSLPSCTKSSNFTEPTTSKVTTALDPKRSTRTPGPWMAMEHPTPKIQHPVTMLIFSPLPPPKKTTFLSSLFSHQKKNAYFGDSETTTDWGEPGAHLASHLDLHWRPGNRQRLRRVAAGAGRRQTSTAQTAAPGSWLSVVVATICRLKYQSYPHWYPLVN